MSILIEASCLVVRCEALAARYQGGVELFMAHADLTEEVRYVVSDGTLVVVSAMSMTALCSLTDSLRFVGLHAASDTEAAGSFVLVDMLAGPLTPCSWLEVAAHRHRFTIGWLTGEAPGRLARESMWRPQDSWELVLMDPMDGMPCELPALGAISDAELGIPTQGDHDSPSLLGTSPTLPLQTDVAHAPATLRDARLMAAQRLLATRGIAYQIDEVLGSLRITLGLNLAEMSPVGSDCHVHVEVAAGARADGVRCRAIVAATSPLEGSLPRFLDATMVEIMTSHDAEIDFCVESDTMSVVVEVTRQCEVSWEDTVERGITTAANAATRVTEALAAER